MNPVEPHFARRLSVKWVVAVCAAWTVVLLGATVPAALAFGAGEANGWVFAAHILTLALAGCLETLFGLLRQRSRGQSKAGALAVMGVTGALILLCAYSSLTDYPLVLLPVCPVPWCVPPVFMVIFPPIVVELFGMTISHR
jgi:hypothetical protein